MIVRDVVAAGVALLAANVPFVPGVDWSAPLTVMTPTSTFMAVVHDTVAVCAPDGGLTTWKISVRIVAAVPESVPGIRVPLTPPKLAVMLAAPFALMATMIIAARFVLLPMMNEGVLTVVTFH